jgi:RNA polymerase sigma-70 factor (ECF subfamily)
VATTEAEEALIAQAVAGDALATHRLLLLHHDRLVAAIDRRLPADLRGAVAAEDICQETYLSVFRDLKSFEPSGRNAFYRWLITIAKRKLIDAVRTRRADKRSGSERCGGGRSETDQGARVHHSVNCDLAELLELLATHERTPSRSAARHELVDAVQRALNDLKPEYREALRLRHIEGLSIAQTAERLGKSEGSVLMLCNRAMRKLADALGDPARFFSRTA